MIADHGSKIELLKRFVWFGKNKVKIADLENEIVLLRRESESTERVLVRGFKEFFMEWRTKAKC
jgi:hypothetical protein